VASEKELLESRLDNKLRIKRIKNVTKTRTAKINIWVIKVCWQSNMHYIDVVENRKYNSYTPAL
jgi:hypothetical protein